MTDDTMTPTARVLKKADVPQTCKDSLGRIIKFKRLKVSDQIDLVTMLGPDRAANQIAQSIAHSAFSCIEIDGEIVFPPETYDDLKEIMDKLDDEGVRAIYNARNGFGTGIEEPKAKEDKAKPDKK